MRKNLIIPCDYFVQRGYNRSTLNSFDVGLCLTKGSQAYMRATVPVYDDDGKYMVGYAARSINNECPICGTYHYRKHPCPRNEAELSFARKWKNSAGFMSGSTLYNIWNIQGPTVILVEGAGDVWRLNEAGCKNAVGLLGCKLTKTQVGKLISKNIQNIVICTDNDDAGNTASVNIETQLQMYFNTVILKTNTKDIGDSDVGYVRRLLSEVKWKLLE